MNRIPTTKSKRRAISLLAQEADEVLCIKTKKSGTKASLRCHTITQVRNFYGDNQPKRPTSYEKEQHRRWKNGIRCCDSLKKIKKEAQEA